MSVITYPSRYPRPHPEGQYTTVDTLSTFSRALTAYKNDGSMVDANNPRFEGIGSVVQAGTVNQFQPYVAGVTDPGLTGIGAGVSATNTRVTENQYFVVGSGAVQCVTNGLITTEGIQLSASSLIPNTSYTFSFYACGSGTIYTYINERTEADVSVGITNSSVITLTSTPTRYSVTRAFGATGTRARIRVCTNAVEVITFYASGFQLELGSTATPWVAGQTRRATTYDKSGLTVEEGTTNLLTAQQAGLPNAGTDGFAGNKAGVTISRVTDAQFRIVGGGALKVVTPNLAVGEGFALSGYATVGASQAVTVSVWLCGSGVIRLTNVERTVAGAYVGLTDSGNITLTATPTRYSVARTYGVTGERAELQVYASGQAGVTFYASGLQVEQKAYATSWQLPGNARNAETCTVPTAGVYVPSQGTLEILVNVTNSMKSTIGVTHSLFGFESGSSYFQSYHSVSTSSFRFRTGNADGFESSDIPDANVPLGLHRFAFRWSSAEKSAWIDGVKYNPILTPHLPTVIPANIGIGCAVGISESNAQVGDVVFSNRARTDAELATRRVLTPLGIDEDTTLYLPLTSNLYNTISSIGKCVLDLDANELTPSAVGNLVSVTPAFARATPAYKLDGTPVASGEQRYEVVQPSPTFTRASTAYKKDGSSVVSGAARFESTGLIVEEGATNLLTANQAALTTGITGFNTNGAGYELTRDTNISYRVMGSGALKCITRNLATSEGWFTINTTVTASNTYTASVWLCGSGTIYFRIDERTAGDVRVGVTPTALITLTTTPTRYSVTRAFGATGVNARLQIITDVQQTATIYASGLQLEQKAYATTWQLPGSARVTEALTVPTAGVISPSQGTFEAVVDITATIRGNTASHNSIFEVRGTDSSHNRIALMHMLGGSLYMAMWNNAGAISEASYADANYAAGLHRIALKWSSAELSMFLDGVRVARVLNPVLSTVLPINMGICSSPPAPWNSTIRDVVFSNRARSDSELAARGVLTPLGNDGYTTLYLPLVSDFSRPTTTMMMVEEGTTNLLAANVANGSESGTVTGFSLNGGTVDSDTTMVYSGLRSIKITGANSGAVLMTNPATELLTYTFSAYVYAPVGQQYNIRLFDSDYRTTITVTGDGTWKRQTASITMTAGTNNVRIYFNVLGTSASINVDNLQLEQKAYATSWMNPADNTGIRNAETLAIAPSAILSPSLGTIEMLVNVTPDLKNGTYVKDLIGVSTTDTANRINLRQYNGNWELKTSDAAGTALSATYAVNNTANGVHRFAITWSSEFTGLWIDGVKVANQPTPPIPSAFPALFYLGSNRVGASQFNTQLGDVVFSNIARNDAELANRGVLTPLGIDINTTCYLPLTSNINEVMWTSPSIAHDYSDRGNHGVITGASIVAAPYGSAFRFDSVDDKIVTLYKLSGKRFSVEAWICPEATPSTQNIIGTKGLAADNFGFFLQLTDNSTRLKFEINQSTDNKSVQCAAGSGGLCPNKWHHVVGVLDDTQISVYVNGVKTTATVTNTSMIESAIGLSLGIVGTSSYRFNGLMGAARCYDSMALTDSEVRTLFESTKWKYGILAPTTVAPIFTLPQSANLVLDLDGETLFDKSASKNHGTNVGSTTGLMPNGNAVYRDFNAVDGHVTCAASASLNTLPTRTVSVWINARSSGGSTLFGRIFDKSAWYFSMAGATNLYFKSFFTGDDGTWTANNSVTVNQWYHVVVTYNYAAANDPIFYVNGISVAVTENSAPTLLTEVNTSTLYIGDIQGGGRAFDGKLLAPHIWNVILTPAEVTQLYKLEKALYGL